MRVCWPLLNLRSSTTKTDFACNISCYVAFTTIDTFKMSLKIYFFSKKFFKKHDYFNQKKDKILKIVYGVTVLYQLWQ
jgi:hypothetical protein